MGDMTGGSSRVTEDGVLLPCLLVFCFSLYWQSEKGEGGGERGNVYKVKMIRMLFLTRR